MQQLQLSDLRFNVGLLAGKQRIAAFQGARLQLLADRVQRETTAFQKEDGI